MATRVYGVTIWCSEFEDAAVKRDAAQQPKTEPHRLSLVSPADTISTNGPLTSPRSLKEFLGPDLSFSAGKSTGNVLPNSADEMLHFGKSTLKRLINRAWPHHGVDPSQWACHQLACYIVEGQQMDVRTADLFTARLEDAGG